MAATVPHLVEGMDLLKPGTGAQYREAAARHPTGAGLRVGRLYLEGTDPAIDQAVDRALRKAGFRVVRLSPEFAEHWSQAQKHAHILAQADGFQSNGHLLGVRGVTPTTKAALFLGNLRDDTKTYDEAIRLQPAWRRELRRVLRTVDFIALPTLKGTPPKIPIFGRLATFEARTLALQNTAPVNYAGNPAIAIPIPLDGGVPLTSLQLIGSDQSEAELLNAARILASK
jgi:Asp-tRNA(Asn)/Glu-tRNA(Gln) amidotransferase A subunit family amidase